MAQPSMAAVLPYPKISKACYCENVANITVSVPDDIYRRARVKAAEQQTSVSALVRTFLDEFAGAETEFERLKRLQDEVIASVESFSVAGTLTREELYAGRKVR
jgi:plasmid stability protein